MQICKRSSSIIHNCKIKQAMPEKKREENKKKKEEEKKVNTMQKGVYKCTKASRSPEISFLPDQATAPPLHSHHQTIFP